MTQLTVIPVPGYGTEDVVLATDGPDAGCVFTGTVDGEIWRVSPDGAKIDRVADTGGRPLGIEYVDGRLIVCDAERGLLRVDPASGAVEVLATEADGRPLVVCNNAAVAGDGTIWFSDSSTRPLARWKADFIEVARTGRLLRRHPDGAITTVLDGLAFANGVALAADESYVVVAESTTRALDRVWITGERAGSRDRLGGLLPGYPDNIALGSDGLIWVALGSPVLPMVERLHASPMVVRRIASRLPERLEPKPKRVVRVQSYDLAGTLVHDLEVDPRDHGADFHMVTGVREHEGRVWVGSLEEPAIAVLDL